MTKRTSGPVEILQGRVREELKHQFSASVGRSWHVCDARHCLVCLEVHAQLASVVSSAMAEARPPAKQVLAEEKRDEECHS